jgi:single-strand DNA-binding protein
MMNSFLGIGRVGADAELTVTRNGEPMIHFSIAIQRRVPKEQQTNPDWIPCLLFGERAPALAPHIRKGMLVGVSGRLKSYRSMDEDQTSRTHLVVKVRYVDFLRWPQGAEQALGLQAERLEAAAATAAG